MFTDIAIGGFKASGKTEVQEYLLRTRSYLKLLACKQPIVDAFEKYCGHAYDKAKDDADLIDFSRTILRKKNPLVVVEYLQANVPGWRENDDAHFVSADMRFPTENKYFKDNGFLCLKIEATEAVRKQRMIDRDGGLHNYKPEDDTERFADELFYHYIVENNTTRRILFLQIERVIQRHFPRAGNRPYSLRPGDKVNIIDESVNEFYTEGQVVKPLNEHSNFYVVERDGGSGYYSRHDLLLAS